MRSGKATALGWAAGLAAMVVVTLAAGLPARAQSEREVLEQQLKEQQARNEDLKQRIEKLEAILNTDVCADPQAAELLLKETQTPQAVEDPAGRPSPN
jgi:predicted transposase YdaD